MKHSHLYYVVVFFYLIQKIFSMYKLTILSILFLGHFVHTNFLFAQNKLNYIIETSSLKDESVLLTPPIFKVGLEGIYNINFQLNKNVSPFMPMAAKKLPVYQIKLESQLIIEGDFSYPQPLSFQYFDKEKQKICISSTFFADTGTYIIRLPKNFDKHDIIINSPINLEFQHLKKYFSDLYVKSYNKLISDSLTDLDEKGKRLSKYIVNNPNSIVALWEIINDYTLHGYNYTYLENLILFSDKIKSYSLFNKLKDKLMAENNTMRGAEFPTLKFKSGQILGLDYFRSRKLTFIDYWSTTCSPCIRAMPEIANMKKEFESKGVNFVSVLDEQEIDRIKLANKILIKNGLRESDFVDTNKEFNLKLGVIAYPLYLLVDQNGIIIAKSYGKLDDIKNRIIDILNN